MTPINQYESEKETSKLRENKDVESASSYITLSDNFKHCKLIHVQILKLLYKEKKPFAFKQIYDKLKTLGTDRTIRSKIYDLEEWGLIEAIHTNVLIVLPKTNVEKEIIGLMKSFANRIGDTIEL